MHTTTLQAFDAMLPGLFFVFILALVLFHQTARLVADLRRVNQMDRQLDQQHNIATNISEKE